MGVKRLCFSVVLHFSVHVRTKIFVQNSKVPHSDHINSLLSFFSCYRFQGFPGAGFVGCYSFCPLVTRMFRYCRVCM